MHTIAPSYNVERLKHMTRKAAVPGALALAAARAASLAATPPGTVNTIGIALVRLNPGGFEMGVDSISLPGELTKGPSGVIYDRPYNTGDYDETPVHKVTITHPFWMSAAEITVEQFRLFRPDYRGSDRYAPLSLIHI